MKKRHPIKITFLGTGTSQGVPVIGCDCAVCLSNDPHDKRLRTSILISSANTNITIDSGPDFRQQMLRAKVKQLDAIVYTHQHNDHIIGLDDVRPFNFRTYQDMPLYATKAVQEDLKSRFAYAFQTENKYPGAPMLTLKTIHQANPFHIQDIPFHPVKVWHGQMPVLGFRIYNFAYLTDMKTIDEPELAKLENLDILVLDALHRREHHSHLNLEQAIKLAQKINAKQTYFIHLSHQMGCHQQVLQELPPNISIAYDGLVLEF